MALASLKTSPATNLNRLLGSTLGTILLASTGLTMAAPCNVNDAPKLCSDGINFMTCVGTSTSTTWDKSECTPSTPQPKGPFPWLIKGTTSAPSVSEILLDRTPGTGWSVVAVADFNGDGQADLLWRRSNDTGEARIWILQGQTVVRDVAVGRTPAEGWRVIGAGDFDGDGKADILWRRSNNTGEARIWYMNVENVLSDASIGVPRLNTQLLGIGDFDGDRRSDIVWGFK